MTDQSEQKIRKQNHNHGFFECTEHEELNGDDNFLDVGVEKLGVFKQGDWGHTDDAGIETHAKVVEGEQRHGVGVIVLDAVHLWLLILFQNFFHDLFGQTVVEILQTLTEKRESNTCEVNFLEERYIRYYI